MIHRFGHLKSYGPRATECYELFFAFLVEDRLAFVRDIFLGAVLFGQMVEPLGTGPVGAYSMT